MKVEGLGDTLTIRGARLHNLRNITASIPKHALVAFTGVSGSGKSTLVLDTIHRESQRQIMESLGVVGFGASRPPMDSIEGLPPSIAVDQAAANRSPRSTLGTATDVYTYLRLLFARVGRRPCPSCGAKVPPAQDVSGAPDDGGAEQRSYPCPACGAAVPEIGMAHFSFNKPEGACPGCTGLGVVSEARPEALVDPERSVADGAVLSWLPAQTQYYSPSLQAAARHYGISFDLERPVKNWPEAARDLLLHGVASPRFARHFPAIPPPATAREGRFEGLATALLRRYGERADDAEYRQKTEKLLRQCTCPDCGGTRLKAEARAVIVDGRTIVDVARLSLNVLATWLHALSEKLDTAEREVAEPVLADLESRVQHLLDVGAGYLTIDRACPSLSAGEAQRLRLAALLGSSLTGVLYVLDEPTVGLHPRDTERLVAVMRRLRDNGNTVFVIEHDLDVLAAADHLVDVGPGAGRAGGSIVAQGTPAQVAGSPDSLTGAFLSGRRGVPVPAARREGDGHRLVVRGARENNLAGIDVAIPLGTLSAVTGVSGSGKSSLVLDILARAGTRHFHGAGDDPGAHDGIDGWEHVDRLVSVDQFAIGRSPRSNAATYSDAFTPIREAFAAQPEARRRGLDARRFSLNVPGGRCERCEGAGVVAVQMHFMPDVAVRCPACRGRRFKPEVLAVAYRGYDMAQVLELSIDEALRVFADVPAAVSRLSFMSDVGLGYLPLGQPATTFSGGEAQRVKLAKELGRRGSGRTLYLLDEPTTGLHAHDTVRLLAVLQRLVDGGSTVVVIEHNLDLILAADWVVDLGPEGGAGGGRVVAQGTPERVADCEASITGRYLRRARARPVTSR